MDSRRSKRQAPARRTRSPRSAGCSTSRSSDRAIGCTSTSRALLPSFPRQRRRARLGHRPRFLTRRCRSVCGRGQRRDRRAPRGRRVAGSADRGVGVRVVHLSNNPRGLSAGTRVRAAQYPAVGMRRRSGVSWRMRWASISISPWISALDESSSQSKREDSELLDPELYGVVKTRLEGLGAAPMSLTDSLTSGLRPTAGAVRNNCDVLAYGTARIAPSVQQRKSPDAAIERAGH